MKWSKGESGNRKGRPRKGESLADLIRCGATPVEKAAMVKRMWALAKDKKAPHLAIKAAEWLAKHGWPEEARGVVSVETDDTGKVTRVIHEYHAS